MWDGLLTGFLICWRAALGAVDLNTPLLKSEMSHEDVFIYWGGCVAALSSGESSVLVGGNDFYASPCISADGSKLAWVTWNHPNMPWDDTELWTADIAEDGSLSGQRKVRSSGAPNKHCRALKAVRIGVSHSVVAGLDVLDEEGT